MTSRSTRRSTGRMAHGLAALALAACASSQAPLAPQAAAPRPAPPAATAPAKDPAAARSLIASGAIVLDVRRPDEYATGHVPGAVNLPVDELPARLAEVDQLVGGDRSRPLVVYCGSGRRAARAKGELEAAGYSHVVNGGSVDDLR